MKKEKKLIRFDWAIKKLLRNKANFDILEGFLSELLAEDIKIKQILESESNKEDENDKHNRVDILVEDSKGDLVIIEVQNSKEYDYFHRILYGTSKVITEHISEGEAYAKVKKIISITIAYFDLGQGKDYIYHGKNQFKGIHHGDILNLADKQKVLYKKDSVYEIFPEYWLIKVSQFNNAVQDKLDEWIYFLKNGEVKENFTAKGLEAAKKKLDKMSLSYEEQQEYKYYLKRLRDIASEQHTKMADAEDLLKAREEGLEKGREEGLERGREEGLEKGLLRKEIEAVLGMYRNNIPTSIIASALNISEEKVNKILNNNSE
ncbi:Rpn family recombination-promoting nuclease/putative transposase [Aureispira sp. CCB-E]|uniref:Rpn family recombination-promoting nuclease/putative transposase n=1 Tax=Aureispira sp. CCB-E TaxID=3051121 RepID=UPI0028687383|nr:Rpn family recombination-promoting nuclease/putative transposase [Aureispira sp. CCB-E]WMX17427.1 Rpn family recombination-promoting nuclease/putative transposase [Aureispira sp. CCB-E]